MTSYGEWAGPIQNSVFTNIKSEWEINIYCYFPLSFFFFKLQQRLIINWKGCAPKQSKSGLHKVPSYLRTNYYLIYFWEHREFCFIFLHLLRKFSSFFFFSHWNSWSSPKVTIIKVFSLRVKTSSTQWIYIPIRMLNESSGHPESPDGRIRGKVDRIVCKIPWCFQGPPVSIRFILGLRKWYSPQTVSDSGWFSHIPLQNLPALCWMFPLLNDPGVTAPLCKGFHPAIYLGKADSKPWKRIFHWRV